MKTLRDLAVAIKATKVMVANAVDGKVVGIDSVSGSDYFQDNMAVGSVYVDSNGKHKVIVDAILYPKHTGDNGKVYETEIRFMTCTFNKDTLVLGDERHNVGMDSMIKTVKAGRFLSIDIWSYVAKREEEIYVAQVQAARAKALADAQAKALAKAKADAAIAKRRRDEELARQAELARKSTSRDLRYTLSKF